jgi:hypothetical protein
VHAGQAHPQPAVADPDALFIIWQTPDGQFVAVLAQGMAVEIQMQPYVLSPPQLWGSVWLVQGSAGTCVLPPVPVAGATDVPPSAVPVVACGAALFGADAVAAPMFEQLHEQAGQDWFGAQTGQAHAQVPPPVVPPPPPEPVPPAQPPPLVPPPLKQVQLHGGQVSPGAHAGQPHVQVPPPPGPPPASPEGGGGQSQATAGQAPFAGQASGCAQVQPGAEVSIA